MMNIQNEVQKIHNQYGMSEKANYKIQLLCEQYAKEYHDSEVKKLNITAVIGSPIQLEPVLAEIEHINDLGKSKWYEVVYFDENWRSYAGSKTFQDGEKVIKWKYVKDCL